MKPGDSTLAEPPFAATIEKYNIEHAHGKVTVSNFPYHVIQSLPGYTERDTPGLTASDLTRELARYLAEYAARQGLSDSLPGTRRRLFPLDASQSEYAGVGANPHGNKRKLEEGPP